MMVFGIMGLFSVKYRILAKQSFRCVFHMVSLRKCEHDLNQKIKVKIVSCVMRRSPKLGRVFYKHFRIFSIIITLLFFGSMFYTIYSLYNLFAFGTCNPSESEGCILSKEIEKECTINNESIFQVLPNRFHQEGIFLPQQDHIP